MGVAYNSKIVTNGLVLCLDAGNRKSYPGSGTVWTDLSGNGRNGTLTNMEIPGDYTSTNGGILTFDGVNEYVVTGNNVITGSTWSISVWINVNISENGAGRQGYIVWGGPSFQPSKLIAISVTGGKVEVAHWANDTTFSNSNITFGNFQNIVVTFDGSTEKIYINSINTDNKSTTLDIGGGVWYISCQEGASNFLNCKISTFSVYNRALTATEIQQNYLATKSRYGL
jgi:hypothetical protein